MTLPQDLYVEEAKQGRWKKIRRWLKRTWVRLPPGPEARQGSSIAILAVAVIAAVYVGCFLMPGFKGILDPLSGAVLLIIFAGLIGLAIILILKLAFLLPRFFSWLSLTAIAGLILVMGYSGFSIPGDVPLIFGIAIVEAFLGGSLALILTGKFKASGRAKKVGIILALAAGLTINFLMISWFLSPGKDAHLVKNVKKGQPTLALDTADRSLPGPYRVLQLTYGSGTDKRRPEFGAKAALKTEPVNATPFIKNNKGWKMKLRKWYWGFDFKKFPVNGRVWFPEGNGPFSLALIVHGNHKMEDYSDPGYAYLGELLASRGFILVSVDENFFNGSFPSGLSKENDGRGWMLLQHLKAWKTWSETPGNPFYGKVDMRNIAVMGHSRGGEAAAIAAAFNRLPRYPDDATVRFDFGFGIKAVVAIAPADGQYMPAGKPTPLENVNYFVIQGGHDSDVSVFAGDRQYKRVKFTDGKEWFKASLFTYRSNHGQFNSVWGDSDWGKEARFIVNRKPLLKTEDQRKISSVYISAFLEATLHGNRTYIPLFRDYRLGATWLPEDIYISRFQDSTFRIAADYEEDVDVTTASVPGGTIKGENLDTWREQDLPYRESGTKRNQVVYLGWKDQEKREAQGKTKGPAASYTVELPDKAAAEWALGPESMLTFSLANTDEKPQEPEEKKDKTKQKEKAKKEEAADKEKEKAKGDKKKKEENEPPDLTIELISADGASVRAPLSRFMGVPPVLKSHFTKFKNEGSIYGSEWEATLQTYEIPLAAFLEANPSFDPSRIRAVRFVFDLSPEGVVILDEVGFSKK